MSVASTGLRLCGMAEEVPRPVVGLMAASGTTDMASLSAWQAAAVSAIPAALSALSALSALKSTLGTVLGRPGTASWLPLKRDPATPAR
ncbi:hypothetical protein [Streptomyces sp. A5-4]|uniref:hypothetical protein n=1 Tax=Streptomyces sp. A5-4 TaxID=3384771 RepID=UPI003DA9D000